jgi:hypothetical protein
MKSRKKSYGLVYLAKLEGLDTRAASVLADRAGGAEDEEGAIDDVFNDAFPTTQVLAVVEGGIWLAAVAGAAVFLPTLGSCFGEDPGTADDPTNADRDVFQATEETTAVVEGHRK